ncbi:hypothetical protein LEMLEM_LOCUS11368 [Lemmus lemmus]
MNDAALGFHVTLSLARERSSDTFSCHQPQSPRTLRTNEARSQMTAGFLGFSWNQDLANSARLTGHAASRILPFLPTLGLQTHL